MEKYRGVLDFPRDEAARGRIPIKGSDGALESLYPMAPSLEICGREAQ